MKREFDKRIRTAAKYFAWVTCVLALFGCGSPDSDSKLQGGPEPPFIEAGDLAQIQHKKVLRVLTPRLQSKDHLPRRGGPLDFERELIEAYARENGLDIYWVLTESRDNLIPALLSGKADLISGNLTVTPERKQDVVFTVPLDFVREQVITRVRDDEVASPADLAGRRLAVRRSSSFWHTLQGLRELYPEIEIQEAPENLDTDELIHRVAQRRLDLTVADSNLMRSVMSYRDDVRVAFDLTGDRPIALAVRPESIDLLRSLDHFLSRTQLARRPGVIHVDDLEQIRKRKVLRVLTRNSAATYFLWRGELMGFEYELSNEFASRYGLRVEVIVPPRSEDLLPWLLEGRGDVVASALTPTDERREMGIAFTRPHNHASQVVVARPGETDLDDAADLAGRKVYVRRSSSYWDSLSRLRAGGIDILLHAAPEQYDTERIIDLVAEGQYDLSVADSHILDIELTWRTDVDAAFPLGDPVPLSWAVRESNPALRAAIDEFFEQEYRGLFYNMIYDKYFKDPRKIKRHLQHHVSHSGELSPFDEIVKRHADHYGFDWRLIVSQMYQESEFNSKARSFAGAVGLLQVLPRTAKQMGFTDLYDPETNIHAGVKYLSWVRDRFEADLPVTDRMWFTLAGYNVGPGHVQDARRLAEEKGWDRDRWFDNVERAMLLLSRREYARKASHGYCRGQEPVQYVHGIKTRYKAYLETLEESQLSAEANPRRRSASGS